MASFTYPEITSLLEDERETERQFVADALQEPSFPRGWSPALLMAHIAEHYAQRGDQSRAARIKEETMAELRRVGAPDRVIGVWS